MSNQPELDSLN